MGNRAVEEMLCHDRVPMQAGRFGSRQRLLCRDRDMLCRDRVWAGTRAPGS